MEIFALFSIIAGVTLITAVIQHEVNMGNVVYLNAKTGKNYRFTRIFGRSIKVAA